VGRYRASDKQCQFWLNGTLVATATFGGTSINSSTLSIGGDSGGTIRAFDGTIDEVVLDNRRWADDEIVRAYAAGKAGRFAMDGSGWLPEVVALSRNDARLYNSVVATRAGGVQQTVEDSTSLTTYGRYSLVQDGMALSADDDVMDWAGTVLAVASTTRRLPEELTVLLDTEPNFPDALIGLQPGDTVVVARETPDGRQVSDLATLTHVAVEAAATRWTARLRFASLVPRSFTVGVSAVGSNDRVRW
jgi:hypothetical protein